MLRLILNKFFHVIKSTKDLNRDLDGNGSI